MSGLLAETIHEANDENPVRALEIFNENWTRPWSFAYLNELGLTLVSHDRAIGVHFASVVLTHDKDEMAIATAVAILKAAHFGNKLGLQMTLLRAGAYQTFVGNKPLQLRF
jgi:hypothetical protein